jgi:precorrin-6Y C5,15-methyltransferase (decarboxylating)
MWVCENLGGADERILEFMPEKLLPEELQTEAFAPLNVVILHRIGENADSIHLEALPLLGIPDRLFLSFSDRPGLMTKREIRILALGELALQPGQNIWDIGAGTGSVAIEMARLNGSGSVYAIEKTSAGIALIQQNCQRFQCPQIIPIQGAAPDILESLPSPDRIFIGGSGGNLGPILDLCGQRLKDGGRMVLALATLEHLTRTLNWLESQAIKGYPWQHSLLQVQLSRSVPIAQLTRLAPLNPVTLVVIQKGRSQ